MAVSAYAPSIPGVTEPNAWDREAPDALAALSQRNEDGTERTPDERAKLLLDVARSAFKAHDWAYTERLEILAMKNGAQFGFWHRKLRRFVNATDEEDENIIRVPINAIRPGVEQLKAKLTAERPIFGCAPATSEGSDVAAGESGDQIVKWTWEQHDLGALYEDSAEGAGSEGTAFLLVEWDRMKGPYRQTGLVEDEYGAIVPKIEGVGDLKFTLLLGDQVAFDPAAREAQGGSFIVVRRRMSRAYLMDCYPDKRDALRKGSMAAADERGEEHVHRFSPATGTGEEDPTHGDDSVDLYTMFYAATPKMPQGARYDFTADGRCLYEGDSDVFPTEEEVDEGEMWPRHRFPVFTFIGDRRGNSPWGRGRTLDAIPIQKAINGCFSKAVQHAALIANAKPIAPKNSDFQWTDVPGQVIRYGQKHNPSNFDFLRPPEMHQGYFQVYDIGRAAIDEALGINASSRGQAPTPDPSGRLVDSLQQKDDERIAPLKARLDKTWADVMTYALRLFRRYADEPRKIRVVGENNAYSLRFFDKSHLAAGTDVQLFNDQSLPTNKSQRMIWLMNFSTMLGNAKDEQQRALLLDLVRLRDFKGYLEKQNPHRVKAIRNNRMLSMGEIPLPDPWDHALTHRATLEEFLCSEEYERLVAEQKSEMGRSVTEEAAGFLWQHFTEKLTAEMNPGMGAPAGGPAPAPPNGLAMSEAPVSAAPQAPQVAA